MQLLLNENISNLFNAYFILNAKSLTHLALKWYQCLNLARFLIRHYMLRTNDATQILGSFNEGICRGFPRNKVSLIA